MTNNGAIPLSDLRTGQEATVVRLEGGVGFVGRLAALGFTPGVTLKVVRNPGHGPIIVSLLDTQIALGRGQASGVQVRPLTPSAR
ncbi:MAG: ferrous iron transport protein A [Chloroflexi bacterium]|nr:ferrous iron transport protein A [Chloroflexota bacterium]